MVRDRKRLGTYDAIVDDYIARFRPGAWDETCWFANQKSLERVIENAAMARAPSGKRLDHQRRIPYATLQAWSEQLQASARELAAAVSFAELHTIISSRAYKLYGVGDLTAYDTTLRIGAFLRLEPEHVYLHAGTRNGARAFGLDKRRFIPVAEFPVAFGRLKASEIEDCLCIYRDDLAALHRTT